MPAEVAETQVIRGTDGDDSISDSHDDQGQALLTNDWIEAGSGNDHVSSNFGDDSIHAGAGDDYVNISLKSGRTQAFGEAGDDLLITYEAEVLLDGGAGNDQFGVNEYQLGLAGSLVGGAGWDILYFHGDRLTDWEVTGIEELFLHGRPVLLDQLAQVRKLHLGSMLVLEGKGGALDVGGRLFAWGNSFVPDIDATQLTAGLTLGATAHDNTVLGTAHDDTLDGRGGDDSLTGGEGHDLLLGNAGADTLLGGDGNDTLGGIAGDDSLTGGAGDDVYRVDAARDVVVELADGGTDTLAVQTGGTWKLGAHVESLRYRGGEDLTATGNASANDLRGGWGDDVLNGWGGNDTLKGGAGWDRLYGNKGDDVISGGPGRDTLAGGEGRDTFVLGEGVAQIGRSVTTITDFSVADDTIRLDARAFVGLAAGALQGGALIIAGSQGAALSGGLGAEPPSSASADPSDITLSTPTPNPSPQGGGVITAATRLIYDRDTGSLAYDADGAGTGAAVTIARLTAGLALTADDFVVV